MRTYAEFLTGKSLGVTISHEEVKGTQVGWEGQCGVGGRDRYYKLGLI